MFIFNPSYPARAGGYNTPGRAFDVCVSGNYAYVADGDSGITILNVAVPGAPFFVGKYRPAGNYCTTDILVIGHYALAIDAAYSAGGIRILDVADPVLPRFAGGYNQDEHIINACFSGNRLYLACHNHGLIILNYSGQPPRLQYIAGIEDAPRITDIFARGNIYAACGTEGEKVLDVSNLSRPRNLGECPEADSAMGIYVFDNRAYVACLESGIKIVDVSDPTDPQLEGTFNTQGIAYNVFVQDNYAYVADGAGGLLIIDVTDSANPIPHGSFTGIGNIQNVYVYGDHAFAVCADYDLLILDVSDRARPRHIQSCTVNDRPYVVFVDDNIAYIAAADDSLSIIKIDNPAFPVFVGGCLLPGTPKDIFVQGGYAYIPTTAGFAIADVNDPADPHVIYALELEPVGKKTAVENGHILLASYYSMSTWRFAQTYQAEINPTPETFSLLLNYPNPFDSQTNIRFSSKEPARVILGIFDITGDRVAELADCYLPAGLHCLSWRPEEIASGVYFFRIQAGDSRMTRRMTLIK